MCGSREIWRRIETNAEVSRGCNVAALRVLRRKIHEDLNVQRRLRRGALDGRLLPELLTRRLVDGAGCNRHRDLLILGRERRFGIPRTRAHTLGAVAHEPVDVVIAFTDVECALKECIAGRIGVEVRNPDLLYEIDRLIFMIRRDDAEQQGQHIVAAREFLQRDGHVIAGVEA